MAVILLAGLQLVLVVAAGLVLWRKLDALTEEVRRLREALGAREAAKAAGAPLRRRVGEPVHLAPVEPEQTLPFPEPEARAHRSAHAWPRRARPSVKAATLSPETARGLALALAATAPALAFFFDGDPSAAVSAALSVAAAMMLVALRPLWRAAAWAAVMTASSWALIGFALGAAESDPAIFAIGVTLSGAAGLTHAYLRRAAPGTTMALSMAVAALALGSQGDMIGPAGAAYATLAALAAILGASSLRLEPVHFAAFGAALVGLFVLSGQASAAIWLTPAATWGGALFLAIAAVRVPQLGARGLSLAGTGTVAPLAAIAALHLAGHGLADRYAAAAALVAVAAVYAGMIYLTAQRRERGLAGMKLTLWALACAGFGAIAAAIHLALPAPLAAGAFAALALGLAALDWRVPNAVWRTLVWIAALLAAASAVGAGQMLLTEAPSWMAWTLIAAGFAAPAALSGGAAWFAERAEAPYTGGLLEALAIALGVAAANLALRTLATGGAFLLTPLGFAEAGLHIAVWLTAALLLAARAEAGAQFTRNLAAMALGALSLLASAAATLLWLTPHWTIRTPAADPASLLQYDGLGFLAPALLFGAHWVFWRARGANLRTRVSLGAGALLLAALATLEALQASDGQALWGPVVGALAFTLALAVNFAPGVTRTRTPAPSYFKESLHSQRRTRRQAR